MSADPNSPPPIPPPPKDPVDPVPLDLTPTGVTEGTGLPRNIAAALACVFVLFGGIVFYILDRRDRFVRFYALQSIVLGAVFFVLSLVLQLSGGIFRIIPVLGHVLNFLLWLLSVAVGIVFLILWVLLIWNSYSGKTWEMPFLWARAKRHIPPAFL